MTPSKSQEELDLERALAESLKDHQEWLEVQQTLQRSGVVVEGAAADEPRLSQGDTISRILDERQENSQEQRAPRKCSPAPSEQPEDKKPERLFRGGDSDDEVLSASGTDFKAPSKSEPLSRSASLDVAATSQHLKPMRPITDLAKLSRSSLIFEPTAVSKAGSSTRALAENETPASGSGKGNVFSVLMKSHSETKEWAKADQVEAANYRGKARSRPDVRTPPFYKILQGMPLCVDGFRFGNIEGCKGYFLTHFHSDHYGGITSNWSHGPIYCSQTTANLVRTCLGVEPRWIRPLPMETPILLPDSGGVTVTCIEANHCPGSCLFLFEGPQTAEILPSNFKPSHHIGSKRVFRYLHCGDFRASPLHANHPLIKDKKLDIIYLDTTYLNPRYCFPAQEQVVEACAELVRCRMPSSHHEDNAGDPSLFSTAFEPAFNGTSPQDRSSALAMKAWLSKGTNSKEEPEAETAVSESEGVVPMDDEFADGDQELGFEDEQGTWADDLGRGKRPLGEADHPPPLKVDDTTTEVAPQAGTITAVNDDDGSNTAKPGMQWLSRPAEAAEEKRRKGKLLVVIGTYTIGKEKIVKAVAKVLRSQVYCADSRKYRVYAQLEDPELHAMLTRDPGANVHVTNLHAINGENLRDTVAALRARGYGFTHAIAFRPTGWTYKPPAGMDTVAPSLERLMAWNQSRNFTAAGLFPTRDSTADYMIYGVPYSEHSSFVSLRVLEPLAFFLRHLISFHTNYSLSSAHSRSR